MPTPQEAQRLFSEIVQKPDEEIDLVEAALLIAASQGSDVVIELSQTHIENMARQVQAHMFEFSGEVTPDSFHFPIQVSQVINLVLYGEEGFHPNRDDYYDPENSYLDRVLATRKGIPITLGLIYMEVARRVGLPLQGIGLPGHFMLGYWRSADRLPEMIIDPFDRGNVLSIGECAGRVYDINPNMEFSIEWIKPMARRQILARMLNNLKYIHMAHQQYEEALNAIDMILIVQPGAVGDLRERAILNYRTGRFGAALKDTEQYIKVAPEGEDRNRLNYYLRLLQRLAVSYN